MPVKKIKKSVKPKINKPAKPVISTKVVTKFGVKHGQIGKYQELANELDIIKTETGDAVKEINKAVDIFLNFAAGNDEKEALTSELIDKVPTWHISADKIKEAGVKTTDIIRKIYDVNWHDTFEDNDNNTSTGGGFTMLPPEEITTVSKIFDDVEMFSNLIGSMSLLLGSTLKLVDEKNMNPHKFFDKTKDLKELRKKAELVKQSEQTMLKVKTKQKTK